MMWHAAAVAAVTATANAPGLAQSCWQQAEGLYGISSRLLYAVASAESDLHPDAVNLSHRDHTGTYDTGLMQINSSHLPRLLTWGITQQDLLDPCTNIKVGAWLLAESFARRGVSWEAVGAYHAACTQLEGEACRAARTRYAWRVYRRLPRGDSRGLGSPAAGQAERQDAVQKPPSPTVVLSSKVQP